MVTIFDSSALPLLVRTVCILLVLHVCSALSAQAETNPDILESGRQSYIESCAFCHGDDARGFGIVSATLEKQPADLTQLKKKYDGVFPWRAVYRTVDGREMPGAHGSREMPIFGDRWSADLPPEYADYYVRGRILEILLYLDSIQE